MADLTQYADPAVYVVDDDEDTRFLLGTALRRRGYATETIDSGSACLARLAESPNAIVVTDIEMPDMTGLELCRELRTRFPGVIAIVVSGRQDPEIALAALDVGAFSFLHKPVSSSAIDLVLRNAIDLLAHRS